MARIMRKAGMLAAFLLLVFAVLPARGAARPGEWNWIAPLPQGEGLAEIAYGEGQYVAVGYGGTIVTSADGKEWTLRPYWRRASLFAVAAGNGRYVAVGDQGTIMTSSDAATWVAAKAATTFPLLGVAYGESGFVAVGTGGQAVRSADGLRWEESKTGASEPLRDVTYGGGQYIAVGDGGTLVASADGVTWAPRSAGDDDMVAVAYGNGRFLAFARTGGRVYASTDGIEWRRKSGAGPGIWVSATFGGGRFVGLTSSGLAWSADGEAWELTEKVPSGSGGVAYGPGGFVYAGVGGLLRVSPDGVRWLSPVESFIPRLESIQSAGNLFIGFDQEMMYTSLDGYRWVPRIRTLDGRGLPQRVIRSAGGYVGAGGGQVWTSHDGESWTASGTALASVTGLAYGNGRFVAVGSGWAVSEDGDKWKVFSGTRELSDLAYGDDIFVSVSESGKLFTSKDGLEWEERADAGEELTSVAFGNGRFVALGRNGTLLVSTDAVRWDASARSEATFRAPGRLLFEEGQFVAAGGEGPVMTSPDGGAWTEQPRAFGRMAQLARANGRYLGLDSTAPRPNLLSYDGSLAAPPCGARFADLPATYPACRAAEVLGERGVVSGYPDGAFRPEQPVTRAEFAKMLMLAVGEQPEPDAAQPFPDATGHWATRLGYLQPAFRLKAITGFPDGTARPDAPLTRAQAVKILMTVRAGIGIFPPGGAEPYVDMQTDAWYAAYARLARTRRLIGPEAPTPVWDSPFFREDEPVIRAEAAILVHNLLMLEK
ncbi:MAG TPA: S-layer homology domain-containing protein [Symbiobacteriaceae bacterium]|nr:S-layer homology domain-containing protein [Symbiobacteriaceae bacterium]